jgi:hypothetical protein
VTLAHLPPDRRFAEEAAAVLGGLGMPPAYAKVLGWLLVCDPPAQTATQIAQALELSKGSVSTGIRYLDRVGLARRVAVPGRRGTFWEMAPDAFLNAALAESYGVARRLMDDGLAAIGGPDSPRAQRLRVTRDFYAFIEREVPLLVERFRKENLTKEEGDG